MDAVQLPAAAAALVQNFCLPPCTRHASTTCRSTADLTRAPSGTSAQLQRRSLLAAGTHLAKAILGVGLLALPRLFSLLGIGTASIWLVFIAALTGLSMHMLTKATTRTGLLNYRLRGSHEEEEEADMAPRSDLAAEESSTKRLLRQAAETYDVPTTVGGAVTSVKHWLSDPSDFEESQDVQMAARLVHRLLDDYERRHGEEFEGQDEEQYNKLYSLTQSVLGSSVSKKVLTRLVRSYLNI